ANFDLPHIVPIYEFSIDPNYPIFIVSKYFGGKDLRTKLAHSHFSHRQSAELVATLAEALHSAHTHGSLHRAVNPSNVLFDDCDVPYLSHFLLRSDIADRDITDPEFIAQLAYMSPESIKDSSWRVGRSTDIFSLGVVFYELLVGHRPFQS